MSQIAPSLSVLRVMDHSLSGAAAAISSNVVPVIASQSSESTSSGTIKTIFSIIDNKPGLARQQSVISSNCHPPDPRQPSEDVDTDQNSQLSRRSIIQTLAIKGMARDEVR